MARVGLARHFARIGHLAGRKSAAGIMNAIAKRAAPPRQAVTLLELIAVVVLLGIFAATVGMRFGRTLFAEFGSRAAARELSLALLSCQRAAIVTGDDHYLEFLSSGGVINQYRIMRDISGTPTLVDGPKPLSPDVTISTSHGTLRFNFEGSALANYQVDVTGNEQVWQVNVIPITGTVNVVQVAS
jgi:prepilin-type N-terminal cleavage/methylation domain-containing protein